jgi:hypothetical protein
MAISPATTPRPGDDNSKNHTNMIFALGITLRLP